MKKKSSLLLLLAPLVLAGCASVEVGNVPMGIGPSYLQSSTDGVPNAAALSHRIWTGYKPSPDLKSSTGPCRVFRIEMASGKAAGHFDIPAGSCTHSGGLAHVGNGKLFLADTRQLFLIDVEKALASGTSAGASQAVKIAGELRGSYATFDGKDTWIGTWTKDQPKARMFRLDAHLFDRYDGQTVKEERAVESIPVPLEAQGAAFDKVGNVWVSASNGKWGKLYRLDRSGNVQAQYQMVAGLEDLTVDASGRLWGLSESGTRKYLHWETRFPYVFQIDTGKLR